MTVHVRYKSLHTTQLSCSKQQPKMIKFWYFEEYEQQQLIFPISLWNWSFVLHL